MWEGGKEYVWMREWTCMCVSLWLHVCGCVSGRVFVCVSVVACVCIHVCVHQVCTLCVISFLDRGQ